MFRVFVYFLRQNMVGLAVLSEKALLRNLLSQRDFIPKSYRWRSLVKEKFPVDFTRFSCCIIQLPLSFVHIYFPLAHLWPFQSLLFCRFLFLQPKHYVQPDPGEWPKIQTIASGCFTSIPPQKDAISQQYFCYILKHVHLISSTVCGLHFRGSLLLSNVRAYCSPLDKHS